MTNREFKTWIAWLDDQLNIPNRNDYYLMQIAGYVSHVLSKKSWQPGDYKLKFKVDAPVQSKQDRDKAKKRKTEYAKSTWRARAGLGREKHRGS